MALVINGVSPTEIKAVKNGTTTSLNVYEYSTKGSDLGEATRSSVSSYTSTQLNNWVGLQNDTWGAITNASSLVADKYYYIRVYVSDTGKYGKFCVKFKSASGTTITVDNMGWGYDGEVIYSTPVWGKPFTLTISQGTGVASVSVNRTSSPNEHASTGALSSGVTIHYGDVLSVSATASDGYLLNDYTTAYTVSGNTSVSVTATEAVWKTIWEGNLEASPSTFVKGVPPLSKTVSVRADDFGLSWLPKLPTKISGKGVKDGLDNLVSNFSLVELSQSSDSSTYLSGYSTGSGTTSDPRMSYEARAYVRQDTEEMLLSQYQIDITTSFVRIPLPTSSIPATYMGVYITEIQQYGAKEQLNAPTLSNIYTDAQDTVFVNVTVSNPHKFSVKAYLTCYDGMYPDIIMGSTSVTIPANGSVAVRMDTGSSGQLYAEATAYLSKTNYFDSEEVVIAE